MENKNNVIEFSENGSEFHFLFVDGSESLSFNTKFAGFEALDDLFKKGKITEDEVPIMRDQIFSAENLPWDESVQRVAIVIGGDFLSLLMSLGDMISAPEEPVEIACFKKCECGENHGRICCRDGYTCILDDKDEAMSALDFLKVEGFVSLDEYAKVKAEIETELSE